MKENTLSQTLASGQVVKHLGRLAGLSRPPYLASLILATLVLAACGGGGGSSGSSGGASGIQVTNLNAIPGSGSLTLTWDNPNANISSFDIEVYDLATNSKNDRVAAVSQANRTISSNPAVNTTAPLAAARYTITSGLVNDSNYSVAVTVNLQGADAGRATSARGLSGRRYLPTNGVRIGANTDADQYASVEDNCPLIKNDDQANTYGGADNIGDVCGDIDNDGTVDVNDNCAVQYNPTQADTNGNGIGDACDSAINSDSDAIANDRDNCPLIANPNQEDGDRDNVGDICDVDADGDGLIELSTAAQLNMMRYNLAGTGLDDGTSDNDNNTGGNSVGCGAAIGNVCNGYEQMADIDLEDLGRDASGSNWEPVGRLRVSSLSVSRSFSGTFSGNDFTISNLFINRTTGLGGVGFFGKIDSTAQIRNVHIRGGNITGVRSRFVGGLVGTVSNVLGATISNSSVVLDVISGTTEVGGLAGFGAGATISFSVATIGSINGAVAVGGLVGNGQNAVISSSIATVGSISGSSKLTGGQSQTGGLVGFGTAGIISSSVATVGFISGAGNYVGGLVGEGSSGTISSSVATVGSIIGIFDVGGLVGVGVGATISSSVATIGRLGTFEINGAGGLVGWGEDATINSSLALTNSINGTEHVGGLVGISGEVVGGNRDPSSVTASYWDAKVMFDSAMPLISNTAGSSQTTAALTNPMDFTDTNSIYATWGDAYCNPNTGEYSATAPNPIGNFIRVWDLGTASQYPAITCVRGFFPLDVQREASRRALAGELPLVD